MKFLELYVDVAEKAGLQNSLTKACSAIGTMYNTLVCQYSLNTEYGGGGRQKTFHADHQCVPLVVHSMFIRKNCKSRV